MKIRIQSLALIASLLLCSNTSQAEIGEITINGEVIPKVLFRGFTIHEMLPTDVCPPTSDAYIRDFVIRRALILMESEKQGYSVRERDQQTSDEYAKKLEYLGPDGNPDEIATAEHLKNGFIYSGLIRHFPAQASHQEILTEYKQLIKDKDPRFTDVVLVRHTPMDFNSTDDAIEAVKLFEQGSSFNEVMEKFDSAYFSTHYSPNWFPTAELDFYEGDGQDLKPGSVVHRGDHRMIYIHETKHRSRLRPFTTYKNNSKNYVYDEIRWELLRVNQLKRDRKLWEAAEVLEDGKPISMSYDYPSCS